MASVISDRDAHCLRHIFHVLTCCHIETALARSAASSVEPETVTRCPRPQPLCPQSPGLPSPCLSCLSVLHLLCWDPCSDGAGGSVVSGSLQPHGLCSLPGSSVHGIPQAGMLNGVAIPFSRGLPDPGIDVGLLCRRQMFHHLSHQGSPLFW